MSCNEMDKVAMKPLKSDSQTVGIEGPDEFLLAEKLSGC
jgi:hypothetical protein